MLEAELDFAPGSCEWGHGLIAASGPCGLRLRTQEVAVRVAGRSPRVPGQGRWVGCPAAGPRHPMAPTRDRPMTFILDKSVEKRVSLEGGTLEGGYSSSCCPDC